MNKVFCILLTLILGGMIAVADDGLLEDAREFLENHPVNYDEWPEVDKAFSQALLESYISRLASIRSTEELYMLMDSALTPIMLAPKLKKQVYQAYFEKRMQVVRDESEFPDWWVHTEQVHMARLGFLSILEGRDEHFVTSLLKEEYGINEQAVDDALITMNSWRQYDMETLSKCMPIGRAYEFMNYLGLSVIARYNSEAQAMLDDYLISELSRYPEKGDLWLILAKYTSLIHAYSARPLVKRLISKAETTLQMKSDFMSDEIFQGHLQLARANERIFDKSVDRLIQEGKFLPESYTLSEDMAERSINSSQDNAEHANKLDVIVAANTTEGAVAKSKLNEIQEQKPIRQRFLWFLASGVLLVVYLFFRTKK